MALGPDGIMFMIMCDECGKYYICCIRRCQNMVCWDCSKKRNKLINYFNTINQLSLSQQMHRDIEYRKNVCLRAFLNFDWSIPYEIQSIVRRYIPDQFIIDNIELLSHSTIK